MGLVRWVMVLGLGALAQCGEGAPAGTDAEGGEEEFVDDGDRTSWDDDMVVMRERYRRLGLTWDRPTAQRDTRCIVRSKNHHNLIIVGEVSRSLEALGDEAPCDYDSVIIGAKTFIVGLAKATDRVLLYNGWKRLDPTKRQEIFLEWFREGLTAGLVLLTDADATLVTNANKAWHPAQVRVDGERLVAEGWVKVPAVTSAERLELRRCAVTLDLTFEGCDTVDRIERKE